MTANDRNLGQPLKAGRDWVGKSQHDRCEHLLKTIRGLSRASELLAGRVENDEPITRKDSISLDALAYQLAGIAHSQLSRPTILDNAPSNANNNGMAKRRPQKFSDQIRQAIRDADCSCYAISKGTGIDQAVLSKFLKGERGMGMGSLDRLGEFLRLEIAVRKSSGGRKR